jgi:tetratricopeptide (TPR) repeat protein
MRRLVHRGLQLLAASLAFAGGSTACEPRPAPPAHALEVHFDGCLEVRAGGECLVRDGSPTTLTFWVQTPEMTDLEVSFNGWPQAIKPVRVQGGLRFRAAIEHAPVLVILRCAGGAWLLHVSPSAELEPLREAERLRGSGDFAAALDALQPMRQHPDIAVRARVLGLLGRIALARGEHREAIADLEQSIRMNRAVGAVSREMNDRYALSFILMNEGDHAASREALRGVRELAASDPTGAIWALYYEGCSYLETADLRRALALFQRASIDAERVGFEELWSSATLLQVQTLHQLGRDTEARTLLEPLVTRIPKAPQCARAEALELLGPVTFKLRQSAAELARAGALLAEAVELYRRACPKPRRLANSLVQLGLVRLADTRPDEAAALLSASRAAHADPGVPLRLGQLELDAMIAEARRDPSAEQKYRRLELHGLTLDDPLTRWRGLLGRGLALERLGRDEAAIAAYEEAEVVLGQVRFNAPLGGGRETFLGTRSESASRLIELLLRRGRIEDALRAARRSRARSLLALAWQSRLDAAPDDVRRSWYAAVSRYQRRRAARERDTAADWQLSADKLERTREERARQASSARALLDEALAVLGLQTEDTLAPLAPASGELVLLYHPIPSGWVGFAVNRAGVIARRLSPEPARSPRLDEVADSLLGPFSALLERSDRVRVLAFGALNRIDFHALPWRGRPLISSVAVRYAVDVARAARPAVDRNALIVTPHDELRSSAAEATIAEERLRADGWDVRQLRGSTVTRAAIMESLAARRISLFLYAGHASFVGLDGWESQLGREDSPLLTVGDILTLPAAPDHAILSGCETATSAETSGAGLGLAQAFVIAGAEWVVASNRTVKDSDAARIVVDLFDQRLRHPDSDIGALLRAVQRELLVTQPGIDWASFRVIVP